MFILFLPKLTAKRKSFRRLSSNESKIAVRARKNIKWASNLHRRRRSFCRTREFRSTNLIGEVGDGAKIAFNILNVGRFKLGASVTGGAKLAVHDSIRYANERQQFGKPISNFGAIKHKLAEMAIRVWVAESITYRTVGMIDALIGEDGGDKEKKLRSIEEYAVESSINKVACSEALDYVVDEMVQIYGGAGYSADYPAEKGYRDSRINRIFEGTNEINRMLIPGQLMKRAMKGQLGIIPAAKALQDEILNPQMSFDEDEGVLATEIKLAQNAKKVALMVLATRRRNL